MSNKQEKKQFEENFTKLESLSQELQDNKISIDQLVPRMKEALSAFKECKSVLRETKAQLTEITTEFSVVDESNALDVSGENSNGN